MKILHILIVTSFLVSTGRAGEIDPSRWRGFNLLEKFNVGRESAFQEDDFRRLHDMGFTFVRLPMDYRCWIVEGDWKRMDEDTLREIDQAVAWGRQYDIHVCLNFHRAPGYTVASPAEKTSLWTDEATQRVCAAHWATFARRYRDVLPEALSFNLLNEPSLVEESRVEHVVRLLVQAIRDEDPDRPIVIDGLEWGRKPMMSVLDLNLIQATRGYAPSGISHYRASWVSGSDSMPPPTWPTAGGGMLYGPTKKELCAPMRLEGPFRQEHRVRLRIGTVSGPLTLIAEVEGREIWTRTFTPGPGEGEWEKAVPRPQWNIYQNVYNLDVSFPVPPGTPALDIRIAEGDWLSLGELGITPAGEPEAVLGIQAEWGEKPGTIAFRPGAPGGPFIADNLRDREWLWHTYMQPWLEAEKQGVRVFVGEWGAYNRTPHAVTLDWMQDCLHNWKRAGWGWALWNFRGSFGVADSGRPDVTYQDHQGLATDQAMLDLLLGTHAKDGSR